MSEQYDIIPKGEPISKSGIQELLEDIRPVWQGRNLIQRVNRLLPVDPSSACQRLFNAAIHDLKEKIIVMGVNVANDAAEKNRLPKVSKPDDILDYNVSKTINLAYYMGILKRTEWKKIHRCYLIRRDLEHEDEEYEADLQDCFYIFKTTIDVVLSRDPVELLQVTDVKSLVEEPSGLIVSEEVLTDYSSAPVGRKQEICEMLISFADSSDKPDVVRENSIEMLRHLQPLTEKTVIIELSSILQNKLDRTGLSVKIAKISHACGALGYFKKVRLKSFFELLIEDLEHTGSQWGKQEKECSLLEDIGGLTNCPKELYQSLLKALVIIYIGERSYGRYRNNRAVFYSNGAAPIIERMVEHEGDKALKALENLRKDKNIKRLISDTYLLRRFERLADYAE